MNLIQSGIPSIYYTQTSKGVSYYYSFKDPASKQTKRKKIFSKEKHTSTYAKQALFLTNDVKAKDLSKSIKEKSIKLTSGKFINNLILNDLATIYFDSRVKKKTRKLKEYYNNMSNEQFEHNMIVKKKIYNSSKEKLRYKKNLEITTLGQTPLNQIDKNLINDFIENDFNTSLSEKSKFTIMSQLKTIVNYGIRKEIININNPFQNFKFSNPYKVRERVLTPMELKLLLQECRIKNHPYNVEYVKKNGQKIILPKNPNYNIYTSVYLAILTGARKDMILNIKKKDIDLKNKEITLVNQKAKMRHYKIPINDKACEWLEKKLKFYTDNEYIIRPLLEKDRQNPPQVMKDIPQEVFNIMDRLFNEGLDKSNNIDRNKVCNFHTLRRSVATNMVKNGTSIFDIMVFLNHSNVEQTMKYLNMNHNNIGREVNKLHNEIFDNF